MDLNKGGEDRGFLFFVLFDNLFLYKKSKDAMKHMILTFKMKGDVDVISDHFLMP